MPFKNRSFSTLKYSTVFILMLLLLNIAVIAQSPKDRKRGKFNPEADASIGLMGDMTFSRDASKVVPQIPGSLAYFIKTQSSSTAGGGLFTFHSAIKPYLGCNVNFSYSQFKQSFSALGGTASINGGDPIITGYSNVGSLNTRMYELTASYAFEGPRFKQFRTFGQFGGGDLFFQPISAYFAKEDTRPAMLFGAGFEYSVNRHLSVRTEYRGLLYKGPNYQVASTGNYPQQRLFTVTNVPAISLVYRFRFPSNPKHLTKGQRDTD